MGLTAFSVRSSAGSSSSEPLVLGSSCLVVQKSSECLIYGEFYEAKGETEGEDMGCSSFHTKTTPCQSPIFIVNCLSLLSQWICPQDQRHLQVYCENVAAILQEQSACLSHWLPYLSHPDCKVGSHMERLNYFVHNPKINAETFYFPLLEQFLTAWS